MRRARAEPDKPLEPGEALQYAVRALSQKALTERELETRLRRRGASPVVIADTLEKLREHRFLSDATLAEHAVRDTRLGSGAIRMRLKARGVDEHTITDALETRDEDADLEGARTLVERYGAKWTGPRGYAKGYAFLARRGFPGRVIHRALEDFKQHVGDEDLSFEED